MRRMKSLVGCAVVMAVVLSQGACTMWKEPKVATWKNTTSVEAMERLLWQEVKAGNWVEVEAHLASNFTASTAGGVLDKQQTIARWKGNPMTDIAIGEVAVTDNGETTVVTYVSTIRYGKAGSIVPTMTNPNPLEATERRMSVWQKQKDGWLMIAHAEGAAAVAASAGASAPGGR